MAYYKAKLGAEPVQVALGTTGGAAVGIPNWGTSVITNSSAEIFVLQPPVTGCEKTLIFHQYSTTVFPVVKFCTNAAQTISLVGSSTNLTVLKSAAGKSTVQAGVVKLRGFNSTSWVMEYQFPLATVTASST